MERSTSNTRRQARGRPKRSAAPDSHTPEFMAWFIAQHGRRPDARSLPLLRKEWEDASVVAARALDLYERTREWDRMANSARYAWNAHGVAATAVSTPFERPRARAKRG